jgi:hypothetical protein
MLMECTSRKVNIEYKIPKTMFLSFLILKKHNRCKKNAYSSALSHKNTTQTNMRGVTSSVIFHLVSCLHEFPKRLCFKIDSLLVRFDISTGS